MSITLAIAAALAWAVTYLEQTGRITELKLSNAVHSPTGCGPLADLCIPDFCAGDGRSGLHSDALNVLLQPLLSCFVETNELDAHPDSPIAGPDNRCGMNSFGIQPEGNNQAFSHGKG